MAYSFRPVFGDEGFFYAKKAVRLCAREGERYG